MRSVYFLTTKSTFPNRPSRRITLGLARAAGGRLSPDRQCAVRARAPPPSLLRLRCGHSALFVDACGAQPHDTHAPPPCPPETAAARGRGRGGRRQACRHDARHAGNHAHTRTPPGMQLDSVRTVPGSCSLPLPGYDVRCPLPS